MELGILLGYSGASYSLDLNMIRDAEAMGYSSAWTAEAYGSDAVTPAAWVLAHTEKMMVGTAIMQMPARTPAAAAMTAMTLQSLSGNRFILGIGPSGPQVIEGWHGVPYGRPLTRTKEYIAIIRQILERKGPVEHQGFHYQLPYNGDGATGLGKPLKSILHGDPSLKIMTGTIAPPGVRTSAEVADGMFPVFMMPEKFDVFRDPLNEGFAKAGNSKSLENFDIAPFVQVVMGDDLEKCRMPVKAHLALYIGGMGARGKNFYTDYATRLGYESEAIKIQDLFLDGKQKEAAAAVPDDLIDRVALVGSKDRITDRLQVWKEAGSQRHVSAMLLSCKDPAALRAIAEAVL